jgi:membrane protease YdiL (CAAX protease family)
MTTPRPSGAQVAFLIVAVVLLSVPAAKAIASALGLPADHVLYLDQLASMSIALAAISGIPVLRRRALELLRVPIEPRYACDIAFACALIVLAQFALFGFRALYLWHLGGDERLSGLTLPEAIGPDGAFAAPTLRHLAIACLLAPFIEELVFRGFLFETWLRTRPMWLAMIFTSLVFAAVHPDYFVPFLGGLLFNAIYVRTGALRAAMVVHFVGNASVWYPLAAQFLVPATNAGLSTWWFDLACLGVIPSLIVVYAVIASGSRGPAATAPQERTA